MLTVLIVPFMELKHDDEYLQHLLDTVLIVPFIELKHDDEQLQHLLDTVLIVPFMELKPGGGSYGSIGKMTS